MQVRRRGRGFLIATLLMALMMTSISAVAAANPPEFIASEPPSGATIANPLTQIVLTFSKPTDPRMTGATSIMWTASSSQRRLRSARTIRRG